MEKKNSSKSFLEPPCHFVGRKRSSPCRQAARILKLRLHKIALKAQQKLKKHVFFIMGKHNSKILKQNSSEAIVTRAQHSPGQKST